MSNLDQSKNDPIFNHEGNGGTERDEGVVTIERKKVKKPPRYKVLLHNDDYTTMEFVIYVLQKIFKKNYEEAERIMFKVHTQGVGVCGIFTREIAETKVAQVSREAKSNGHPLRCSLEPEN